MESTLYVFLQDGAFLPCDRGLNFDINLLCENSIKRLNKKNIGTTVLSTGYKRRKNFAKKRLLAIRKGKHWLISMNNQITSKLFLSIHPIRGENIKTFSWVGT